VHSCFFAATILTLAARNNTCLIRVLHLSVTPFLYQHALLWVRRANGILQKGEICFIHPSAKRSKIIGDILARLSMVSHGVFCSPVRAEGVLSLCLVFSWIQATSPDTGFEEGGNIQVFVLQSARHNFSRLCGIVKGTKPSFTQNHAALVTLHPLSTRLCLSVVFLADLALKTFYCVFIVVIITRFCYFNSLASFVWCE